MADSYFDSLMINRQVLSWTVAARLQLDRWEALVAENLRNEFEKIRSPGTLIWQMQSEHHFCLIAVHHLLTSLNLGRVPVKRNPGLLAELEQGRHLHEHWKENVPVFNVTPRQKQLAHLSGTANAFAARNPSRSPYAWWNWDSKVGPKLLPNVPAAEVHAVLDRTESYVLRHSPEMTEYLPPRPESPWVDGWWPRPRVSMNG